MLLNCQKRTETFTAPAVDSLYFVFLNTHPDRETLPESRVMELQQGHMANIQRLAAQGSLRAAGPFAGGGGIFILTGESIDGVQDTLKSDPAIAAGRFRLEIYPMRIAAGRLISRPADHPFEMVQLSSLRYREQAPNAVSDLWFHAVFPAGKGGIMLSGTEAESLARETAADADPGLEIKTIWIARDLFRDRPPGEDSSKR